MFGPEQLVGEGVEAAPAGAGVAEQDLGSSIGAGPVGDSAVEGD